MKTSPCCGDRRVDDNTELHARWPGRLALGWNRVRKLYSAKPHLGRSLWGGVLRSSVPGMRIEWTGAGGRLEGEAGLRRVRLFVLQRFSTAGSLSSRFTRRSPLSRFFMSPSADIRR